MIVLRRIELQLGARHYDQSVRPPASLRLDKQDCWMEEHGLIALSSIDPTRTEPHIACSFRHK